MAWTIDWSESALADLEAIIAYIARDNQSAAESVGESLIAAVEQAAVFPEMGRIVPEKRASGVRELVVAPYRVFYMPVPARERIVVAHVWHAARGEPPIS